MKTIFKVIKKCSVPGCSCTDCFSVSRGSGGAVTLCKKCAEEIYAAHKAESRERKKGGKRD